MLNIILVGDIPLGTLLQLLKRCEGFRATGSAPVRWTADAPGRLPWPQGCVDRLVALALLLTFSDGVSRSAGCRRMQWIESPRTLEPLLTPPVQFDSAQLAAMIASWTCSTVGTIVGPFDA